MINNEMGGNGGGGRVKVVSSKGCSRLFVEISSSLSFRGLQSFDPMSPASSSSVNPSAGPFSGLVICVTGLSKEARKQVMEATERLGGQYSPDLHPQCTHLVVQSFRGRKFEYAMKHGSRNGVFVVTLGWFVDSVRRNVRLSESLYSVKSVGENGMHTDDMNRLVHYASAEHSCLPVGIHEHTKQTDMIEEPCSPFSEKVYKRNVESTLSGHSLYVDLDISPELQSKVVEAAAGEGAKFVDKWFVGCSASHVVCEGPSTRKYLGHSSNIVTPLWVLKTAKEKCLQRLVHLSADLARQIGTMLDNVHGSMYGEDTGFTWTLIQKIFCRSPKCGTSTENNREINGGGDPQDAMSSRSKSSQDERQKTVNLAKIGVRKRRGHRMQTCQTPIRPITPNCLLDSICWSISELTSTASIYTDSSCVENGSEHHTSVFFDAKGDEKESEASFVNLARPLTESERTELIIKNHFLTILFPVDRFAEMGPCSRTFFSDTGFTCLQVLDHIYTFYQENMSAREIEMAIHTDSRHADRLRSVYSNKETTGRGDVAYKRIDFLGSRKSFEMLKRVSGDNSSNVYELLIRA